MNAEDNFVSVNQEGYDLRELATKRKFSFYVNFKIETQNTLFVNITQPFETDIERIYVFVANSHKFSFNSFSNSDLVLVVSLRCELSFTILHKVGIYDGLFEN